MIYILKACRPKQWTKNLLVFTAPLFAFQFDLTIWIQAFYAFLVFCLISSSIYLLNDCIDFERDKYHPIKKFRVIASGFFPRRQAILLSIFLSLVSFIFAFSLNKNLFLVIFVYTIIQILYCFKLKEKPILDLFCIASGFVLRAIGGGISANLFLSTWFLLTVGLMALFLAIEKRKAELSLSREKQKYTRKVLLRYSMPLLIRLENLVSTSGFLCYSLWASGGTSKGSSSSLMLLTIPFILFGIFRYKFISDSELQNNIKSDSLNISCEQPEEILLNDKGIQIALLGWFITFLTVSIFD